MPHCISVVILQGDFDWKTAKSYDLVGIKLGFDLTMFFLDHYYTAYWSEIIGVSGELPGKKPEAPTFPYDLVIAYLMMNITAQTELMYTIIQTDYFGGIEEQWAFVYRGTCLASDRITTINPALKFLEVKHQNELDEFDTVGLGNYRSMPEYLDRYIELCEQLGL